MTANRQVGAWAAGWGIAIVIGMITLVSGAFLGALWYAETEGYRLISAQQEQLAGEELELLATLYVEEGRASAVRAIERQTRGGSGAHRIYALRGPNGEELAGNLSLGSDDLEPSTPWSRRLIQADGRAIHVAARRLADGALLAVGRDEGQMEEFRDDLLDSVWIAVSIVAITCLAIAAAIIAYILSRVRDLSAVAASVASGEITARAVPLAEGGPFGEIAAAQNAMLDRIEHLVTGLTTVTDSLAHDLRTPLARIQRTLEEGLNVDANGQRQALEAALAQTQGVISTFASLIDIARAEGGLSRAAMDELDIGALIREVYDLIEPLAQEKEVAITLMAPEHAPMRGHRPLLMQAITNLLHNAIKFSPPGGEVSVAIVANGDRIDVTVADAGPGIPEADRDMAKQRFKQVGPHDPEGHGLGLAIVDACARLHRGRLTLEDNLPGLRAHLELATR